MRCNALRVHQTVSHLTTLGRLKKIVWRPPKGTAKQAPAFPISLLKASVRWVSLAVPKARNHLFISLEGIPPAGLAILQCARSPNFCRLLPGEELFGARIWLRSTLSSAFVDSRVTKNCEQVIDTHKVLRHILRS
jgi:hypothetical protein